MENYITLKDSDVISMDEATGEIEISVDALPADRKEKDRITIHYEEDLDNISHEYYVKDFDIDNRTVTLSWVKQLDEALLTEGPIDWVKNKLNPSLSQRVSKQMQKTNKANMKDEKNIEKVIARDMSPEARDWKFYFPDSSGKYGKPVSQEEAKEKYEDMGDYLTPEVEKAIVVTPTGYIVRKGTKDLYRKGFKFNEKDLNASGSTSTSEEDPKKPEGDTPPEKDPSDDPKKPEEGKKTSETGEEDPKTKEKETSDSDKKQAGRYDLGISSKTYGHFLKLLYVMRPKLYDAFDKPVDVTDIKTLADKVKYNNLADFEIEIGGKKMPAITWIKTAVKNKVLMEKVLKEAPQIFITDDELLTPGKIDFKDKIQTAIDDEKAAVIQGEKQKKMEELKLKYSDIPEIIKSSLDRNDILDTTIDLVFDKIVPSSGPAETVGGEFLRAITRIIYRDLNDGDKFFEGYGLETCGSSAQYLFDNGFESDIEKILDQAEFLSEDDEKYTDAINTLATHILERLASDSELLWTPNEEDSREYSYEYIEEHQPTYEFELYGSDDVITLVNDGILNSWDLIRYVESQLEWESAYRNAEVERPWSHHDTSVTVSNLTRDGYELLKDSFKHSSEAWWKDLTDEYADELDDSEYDDEYQDDGSYENDD